MPEIDLKQSGFMYSPCRPFNSNKEKKQKFKQTVDSQYIFHNKLNKVCFQNDIAYEDFKGLTSRTASDKVLFDKSFNFAKTLKWYEYIYTDLLQWFTDYLIKSFLVVLLHVEVNLAGMKLISKYNKGFPLLLSAIDIFSKYGCFVPFKDKKGIKITNNFQNNFWWV